MKAHISLNRNASSVVLMSISPSRSLTRSLFKVLLRVWSAQEKYWIEDSMGTGLARTGFSESPLYWFVVKDSNVARVWAPWMTA